MKKLTKKIITLVVLVSAALAIVGCSGGKTQLSSFLDSDVKDIINDRKDANLATLQKFYQIGALSESQYNAEVDTLEKQAAKLIDAFSNNSDKTPIIEAVRHYITRSAADLAANGVETLSASYTTEGGGSEQLLFTWNNESYYSPKAGSIQSFYGESSVSEGEGVAYLPDFYLGDYIHRAKVGANAGSAIESGMQTTEPAQIIEFLTEGTMEQLNEAVRANIYVLDDKLEGKSLDEIIAVTSNIDSYGNSADKMAALDKYFKPLKDKEGNNIKLVPDKDEYKMVKVSDDNTSDFNINKPGVDLWVHQPNDVPACSLKFREFNDDAVEKLKAVLDTEEYLLVGNAKDSHVEWRAYLMVYPVYVVDEIKNDENNDKQVEVTFKPSANMGINIKTLDYIKYSGNEILGNMKDTEGDFYLSLKPGANEEDSNKEPLILAGQCSLNIFTIDNSERIKVYTGRIILRDYLEGTFAPEFVYGSDGKTENVVAFGRKIRLNTEVDGAKWADNSLGLQLAPAPKVKDTAPIIQSLYLPKETNLAYYVDANGDKMDIFPELTIHDFIDQSSIRKKSPIAEYISFIGEQIPNITSKTYKDGDNITITNIEQRSSDEIQPTMPFPSGMIGSVGYNSGNKDDLSQAFYVICTKQGIFDSALFSAWINSAATENSLAWWCDYLERSGINYPITVDSVTSLLSNKYNYEMSQSGVVILDLETVAKIQQKFDEDAKEKKTELIRTIFMIIGWIVVLYSIILMLAWVIDANTDIGVKLLEKLTFGNWVAIKYEEDIPYRNVNDQTFLSAKKMIVRVFILIAVGILLINVNIFNIVLHLIEIFGRLASKIESMIKGFN